ncbi:hypothetical protein [Nitratidesulfovibrio sp. 1201_IL3209]|uniref:hypothetical protein n=1 Tax=Nitratidesulfovibrio sp. 1201_IL3209 TaxID=3084053 RepID=UPI002FD90647
MRKRTGGHDAAARGHAAPSHWAESHRTGVFSVNHRKIQEDYGCFARLEARLFPAALQGGSPGFWQRGGVRRAREVTRDGFEGALFHARSIVAKKIRYTGNFLAKINKVPVEKFFD